MLFAWSNKGNLTKIVLPDNKTFGLLLGSDQLDHGAELPASLHFLLLLYPKQEVMAQTDIDRTPLHDPRQTDIAKAKRAGTGLHLGDQLVHLHQVQLNVIESPLPLAPRAWTGARVGLELAVRFVAHLLRVQECGIATCNTYI